VLTTESGGSAEERTSVLPVPLFPTNDWNFAHRKIDSFSFTSLAHTLPSSERNRQFGDTLTREQDEREESGIENLERESVLPKGERTGSMMHEILERISYKEVFDSESPEALFDSLGSARETVENSVASYRVAPREDRVEGCVRESLRWVWNVLQLKLPIGNGFSLGQLAPWDRLHEKEFYYPLPDSSRLNLDLEAMPSLGIRQEVEGFLNGFIDLVFRADDKYYLLDWKTNSLEDYSPESVERSMEENSYTLQYEIYSIALHRLLETSLPSYDPAHHFGGVLYLYLRGIDPSRPEQGVYWKPSDQMKSMAEIERSLFHRVHGIDKALEAIR